MFPIQERAVKTEKMSSCDLTLLHALIRESDLPYEYQILEEPYNITNWLRYYWHQDSDTGKLFVLQRGCYTLKRSYKLWSLYLDHRLALLEGLNPLEYKRDYELLNREFEQSLELLNKMPLIWVKYLTFLSLQPDVTRLRRTFNEALRTLPVSQHHWIWPLFLKFADEIEGATGAKIYLRYYTYEPSELELVTGKLIQFKDFHNGIKLFDKIISDETFVSTEGKSPLELWLEYFDLLAKLTKNDLGHDETVEKFIRNGLQKYPDQQGNLYVKLATYFIKRSSYSKARDIFREGLQKVLTIRDFTVVYDGYSEFEESVISKQMELIQEKEETGDDVTQLNLELDFRLSTFEKLMDNRPLLISDVKLRQNQNNVQEWLNRIEIFPTDDLTNRLQTYVKAITTIEPTRATEGLSKLWIGYSRIYEQNNDLRTARTILDKAVKVPFNSPDELVSTWLEWSEMELRQDDLTTALKVLEVATRAPEKSKIEYWDDSKPVQARIHKSIKLWSFYLDLIESSGDLDKTCEIYERVFELKIATPLTVINYANFLEDEHRYEESFKAYEKGIAIFKYPVVFEIWNIYLTKAMKRLSLERMRDLFDHALEGCPADLSKSIYLLYSKLELDSGSIQRALKLLQRATQEVDKKDKVEIYEMLIQTTIENYGLSSSRPYFSQAIESLPVSQSLQFLLKFAKVESQLKEFTRVRALLSHGAMLVSPTKNSELWSFWHDFEIENGDKDTYKQMLKTKRQATDEFNTTVDSEAMGFVKSSEGPKISSFSASEEISVNPDAIDLEI